MRLTSFLEKTFSLKNFLRDFSSEEEYEINVSLTNRSCDKL